MQDAGDAEGGTGRAAIEGIGASRFRAACEWRRLPDPPLYVHQGAVEDGNAGSECVD